MPLELPLSQKAKATLSIEPHSGRYRLEVKVLGQRPRTGGIEPDLHLYPKDGGLVSLRAVIPITGSPSQLLEWRSAYGVEGPQLMLLAIYPMVRLRLDPWTGVSGVELDDPAIRAGLMLAAQRVLGLHP